MWMYNCNCTIAVRDYVARGDVSIDYISTDLMAADLLTKVVSRHKHHECCNMIGMVGL